MWSVDRVKWWHQCGVYMLGRLQRASVPAVARSDVAAHREPLTLLRRHRLSLGRARFGSAMCGRGLLQGGGCSGLAGTVGNSPVS